MVCENTKAVQECQTTMLGTRLEKLHQELGNILERLSKKRDFLVGARPECPTKEVAVSSANGAIASLNMIIDRIDNRLGDIRAALGDIEAL